ncbi:Hypothetical protein IALB_2000 [Ignavibacterium album JCM 16511]|uniref:Uncharacterized protein n=1 Tax=Ignavibacterium album (strain DSM 19864 / JCM 16511 / NBRC 101810 / Mat9-16) TaxID=945713 RepID=I0AL48_IGNAJ|nr:hypothetical protein [Ignavibacterium album]AFH49705.1 Hypothetical protein IALB_2000 [Ignavibacterium album JCM 16511]
MADNSISLVVISDRIIFNENSLKTFETLSIEDTKLLFGTLFLNLIENLNRNQNEFDLTIYAEKNDNDLIQTELSTINADKGKLFFYDSEPDFTFLSTKIKSHMHSIFVYSDVMGVSSLSIKEILNLLNTDENTIVIGTSKNSSVCLIGFNHLTENLLKAIQFAGRDYSKLLSLLKSEEHFIHTLNRFVRVYNIQSFKELYDDLSQKKSIEYCSQEMHEKFTHLFVEYKDLLK